MTSRTSSILLRSLKNRFYGTAAAEASQRGTQLALQGTKVTKLKNGLTVVTAENYSPLSQIGVIVNGGARFESGPDKGLCHFLRDSTVLSTKHSSALAIVRTIGQTGGNFGITATREYMIYHGVARRSHIQPLLAAVRELTTEPAFKKWEIESGAVQRQMLTEILDLAENPALKLLDLTHEAAYRDTLGNPLYAQPHMLKKFNKDQILNYVKQNFTQGRMVLVGLGVDHNEMVAYGEDFVLPAPVNLPPNKATYHGGEMRYSCDESMTHVAVVTEGCSLKSKELFPLCVLQMIMGSGPQVKYSADMSSRLNKCLSQVVKNPFAISCLNANYTDSGLFGFYLIAQPKDMAEGVNAAMSEFKNISKKGVTEQEVARGKTLLKAGISMNRECNQNVFLDLAEQAIGSDKIYTTEDLLKMVDAVNPTDVNTVAKKVATGKPALACLGDISYVPYLD